MFTPRQITELLEILQAPVTDFDCGKLCAPENDGEPFCCSVGDTVPILYRSEYAVLKKRTKMWSPFQPRTAQQKTLSEDLRSCDMLVECKGAALCERANRSLVCRTFPFEPYLDHHGELAGLVYNQEFGKGCPLVNSKHPIRQDYVEQALKLWLKVFAYSEEERDFHFAVSQNTRRSYGQMRKPVPVLTPEGWRKFPTRRG